jgi:hypothetical protein
MLHVKTIKNIIQFTSNTCGRIVIHCISIYKWYDSWKSVEKQVLWDMCDYISLFMIFYIISIYISKQLFYFSCIKKFNVFSIDWIINFGKICCQLVGYKIGDRGCCGTGKIEVTYLCNHLDPICPNDLDYVFWDSFHPTESAYRKLVGPILQKYMHKLLWTNNYLGIKTWLSLIRNTSQSFSWCISCKYYYNKYEIYKIYRCTESLYDIDHP